MSDAVRRMKVSRQGLALIKSFEGFRPRAARVGGGWMIGYGHTASAREDAVVGEAEAELLLQYDLAPVVKALNAFPADLNQNQFDALASFALSLGVKRFLETDAARKLAGGQSETVPEALFALPWSPHPDAGLQRRAAERALFTADPAAPPSLAELLSAPLSAFPVQSRAKARAAAVAALLGEDGLAPFPAASDQEAEDGDWKAPPEAAEPETHAPAAETAEPLLAPPAVEPDPAPTAEPAAPDVDKPAEPVMRHEQVDKARADIDWTEAGMYLVMGLLGLVACAFAGAAFRWSLLTPTTDGQPGTIAWALAIIGVMCVGVSAWNLYACLKPRD